MEGDSVIRRFPQGAEVIEVTAADLSRLKRSSRASRGWLLRRSEFEAYLSRFGGHERLAAFARIASRIEEKTTFWRCLRETWLGDDAPGLHGEVWEALWALRTGREHVMTPEERALLEAIPDPVPVWRGTARPANDRGWSWTTSADRAVWFARWHANNRRITALYGVAARGTPTVLEGRVPRRHVLAVLSARGEDEIVVPFTAVEVVRSLSVEDSLRTAARVEHVELGCAGT
jgi:hypothetical protein